MSNFNAADYIEGLPSNIRQQVLFSIVGSLNSSLVGIAQGIARRIQANDTPVLDLDPFEIKTMLAGMDNRDGTEQARKINALAQHWRDDLIALTDKPSNGSLGNTIDFMINQPRQLDEDLAKAALKAAGLPDVPTALIKVRFDDQQKKKSEALAAQRGEIEWIIEQGLCDQDDDGYLLEAGNVFSNLDENLQQRISEKLVSALERTRDTAVVAVLNRDKRWSFGDLPVIGAAIAEVKQHI